MLRSFLIGKIHRATVTGADPDYEGSITVDRLLMDGARMAPFEQVHVYNVSSGKRFVTYLMSGEPGSGEIVVNGAAALLVRIGDRLIIAAYGLLDDGECRSFSPAIVQVDDRNRLRE